MPTLEAIQRRKYRNGEFPPRYPVPTTLGETVLDGYAGVIYINQADGDDWIAAWDAWGRRIF